MHNPVMVEEFSFAQALDRSLEKFGISGKWLSEQSGVSQQMISRFRKGNQRIYSDSLEKILEALPLDAKQDFFDQLRRDSPEQSDFAAEIYQMNRTELASLLIAIAGKLNDRNSTTIK